MRLGALALLVSCALGTLAAQTRVVLETEKGVIEVEVEDARAPITTANFLRYLFNFLFHKLQR